MDDLISPREKQVILLLMQDYTYKMIGEKLGITKKTVYDHTRSVRDKLGVETLPGMIYKAIEFGIRVGD